ncbi:hypothetical protein JOC77_002823 [Peribacillus deserti]|uniref:Uncharacterized protein n=1 Tax=Peribacillus deserti TaxID=673318 RepID=A0ABS2QLP6_9BACI|nr:hypothetical protein [Peribacillus deserti]
MRHENVSLTEFTNEEGFELKSYISQLFEHVSAKENETES